MRQSSTPVYFESREAWEAWLDEHHATAPQAWVKIAKKASGIPSVSYDEAVEVALCYGWIDGQMRSLDSDFYVQRFTPRSRRSRWSKLNREKVARLIETGAMKPAGLREVELAKADGRWDAAYDSPTTATVPDDLREALEQNRRASQAFAALDSRNRYAILHRLQEAKKPQTRQRRIEQFVAMLAEGKWVGMPTRHV
jgi:uncharacterized protein YdeI (YjbR/CyaY-like superfamily)